RSEGRPHADVLRRFIDVQTKLLAPFVPHAAEEIWHRLRGEGFVVNSRYPEDVAGEIDPRAEAAEALLQSTMADIREILKVTEIGRRGGRTRMYCDGSSMCKRSCWPPSYRTPRRRSGTASVARGSWSTRGIRKTSRARLIRGQRRPKPSSNPPWPTSRRS